MSMALAVDESRVAKVYVKLVKDYVECSSDAVERNATNDCGSLGQGVGAPREAIGETVEHKDADVEDEEECEGSELNDSEYSLQSDREDLPIVQYDGVSGIPMPEVNAQDEVGREENDDEDDVQSEYAGSDELESCSSTNEDELDPIKPRYVEFNEQIDMKNPQFKIGIKFWSF